MVKQVEYLTPREAAIILGMSRPAFLKHVKAKKIVSDNSIGTRDVFSRESVERFKRQRKDNGARKRGPKPAKSR